MTEQELVEKLAHYEHASWARWMEYLFSQCEKRKNGDISIPSRLVTHWKRQVTTPYERLTYTEQESDRKEVREALPTIRAYVESETLRAVHEEVQHHRH